ncbi:hypothetical protein [Muricoccus radiodurans]|uniref:hypothetical protein n=1 Tax=Muricoccus radiodurans TaxID=2231721 RepID=UPI003CEFF9E4
MSIPYDDAQIEASRLDLGIVIGNAHPHDLGGIAQPPDVVGVAEEVELAMRLAPIGAWRALPLPPRRPAAARFRQDHADEHSL